MATAKTSARSWCRKCGTQHERSATCPGELLAVGAERYGWRGLADTPRGPEVYGALVAPVSQGWRARILTFPNILWVARDPEVGSMKFLADTPAAAETMAVNYIRAVCKHAGFTLRKELPYAESAKVDPERSPSLTNSEAILESERKLKRIRIRYGVGRPTLEAETDDISEGGLFILTTRPLPIGTELQMYLESEELGFPLKGAVRWSRDLETEGRPVGMGIRLIAPHPRYLHFVRQLLNGRTVAAAPEADREVHELELWESAGEIEEWMADPS